MSSFDVVEEPTLMNKVSCRVRCLIVFGFGFFGFGALTQYRQAYPKSHSSISDASKANQIVVFVNLCLFLSFNWKRALCAIDLVRTIDLCNAFSFWFWLLFVLSYTLDWMRFECFTGQCLAMRFNWTLHKVDSIVFALILFNLTSICLKNYGFYCTLFHWINTVIDRFN